jgi:organic radical activating enzyme
MIPIKVVSSKQLKMIWQITTACTYACDYCPKELHEGSSKNINLDELEEFLDKFKDREFTINFTGGEPTIHPQFLDILKILKRRNIKVISDTNLSRSLRFYEEAGPLVDNWCVTLHPSEHIFDAAKINALSQVSYTVVYVMMDPRHWDKAMSWWTTLQSMSRLKIIVLKPLSNWSNSGWYYKHTEEQQEFYNTTPPIYTFSQQEIAELSEQYTWLKELGSTVTWNDGTETAIDIDQLMKQDLHKFKGWRCEAGNEVIVIEPGCHVSLATCGTRHLGHWTTFDISQLEQSFVCPRDYCHCGIDIKATKTKI